jgi:hypothetical protein
MQESLYYRPDEGVTDTCTNFKLKLALICIGDCWVAAAYGLMAVWSCIQGTRDIKDPFDALIPNGPAMFWTLVLLAVSFSFDALILGIYYSNLTPPAVVNSVLSKHQAAVMSAWFGIAVYVQYKIRSHKGMMSWACMAVIVGFKVSKLNRLRNFKAYITTTLGDNDPIQVEPSQQTRPWSNGKIAAAISTIVLTTVLLISLRQWVADPTGKDTVNLQQSGILDVVEHSPGVFEPVPMNLSASTLPISTPNPNLAPILLADTPKGALWFCGEVGGIAGFSVTAFLMWVSIYCCMQDEDKTTKVAACPIVVGAIIMLIGSGAAAVSTDDPVGAVGAGVAFGILCPMAPLLG